jgi:mRNA-degrading endonuclease toxin of MazEF toxin-antitoxin module
VSPGTPSVALDKQRLIRRLGTVSTEVLETTLETVQAMFAVR